DTAAPARLRKAGGLASTATRARATQEPPRSSHVENLHSPSLAFAWSGETILSRRRARQSLVDEFLHAVALGLAGHQIAVRINSEAVDVIELTGFAPRSADLTDLLQRRAIEDCDPFVRAVCDINEALFRIGRQGDPEGRTGSPRLAPDKPFLQKR